MKHCLSRIALLVLTSLATAAAWAQDGSLSAAAYERAAQDAIRANRNLRQSPYTVIVRLESNVGALDRNSLAKAARAVPIRSLMPAVRLELWGTPNPSATIAFLKMMPGVRYAEPDYVVSRQIIPNDTSFGTLWGLHNTGQSGGLADADIDAPEAWDTFTGSSSFVVADIDTGVDYNHPDLAANIYSNPNETVNGLDDDGNGFVDDIRGWDFVNNDNNPIDDNNHGTHVAGTIGAVGNNGIGVAGVNWNVKIMPLKFLNASGSGSTSVAISCLNYAVSKGVKVSNNSWGGGGFSQALFDAITNARNNGHLFVAAAGNSGSNNDAAAFYPANYNVDNVISVASIDRLDNRSSFSNYGATTVDLGAPGSAILSTVRNGGYSSFNGTSMATPHVVGVAALVWGQNPTMTYAQVRDRLFSTVRPVASLSGITVTGGVVNAAAALGGGGGGNTPPSVGITSPSNGASFTQGANVNFAGSATDPQDGDVTSGLTWTSNLQGVIGNGGSFSRNNLVVGTHVITASVTDSGGLPGSAQVTISITSGATIPPAPSNLSVIRIANDRARLTWTDNSSNETNFDIQRQRLSWFWWTNTTNFSVGANVTSFENQAGNGTFRYRVRARNAAGSSAYTGWVQASL
jgi:subtilisin family serine protease